MSGAPGAGSKLMSTPMASSRMMSPKRRNTRPMSAPFSVGPVIVKPFTELDAECERQVRVFDDDVVAQVGRDGEHAVEVERARVLVEASLDRDAEVTFERVDAVECQTAAEVVVPLAVLVAARA